MKTAISELNVYLVGGAVRDIFMGYEPEDYDYVVIGSSPEEMISLGFEQVGADFPVFLHPETKEEYALARRERKVGTGYLGFECEFGVDVTLEEDLSRRDFRSNSMAMNSETGEIFDPFNGRADIANGILHHTSDAFKEDPLRVLRMARFAVRYDWEMASETYTIAKEVVASGALNEISDERFWRELEKVISEDGLRDFIHCLADIGALKCKFFKNALPCISSKTNLSWVGNTDQLSVLCANSDTTIWPSTTAKKLFSAMQNFDVSSGEKLFNTLMRLDAFRQSSLVEDCVALQYLSIITKGAMRTIKVAVALCNTVSSDDFYLMGGALLGKAIKEKRIQLLDCLFA